MCRQNRRKFCGASSASHGPRPTGLGGASVALHYLDPRFGRTDILTMPGAKQDVLLDWFCRFFAFAEKQYHRGGSSLEPLLEFVSCWEYWWEAVLSDAQQQEIRDAAGSLTGEALQGLVTELRRYLARQLGGARAAAALLLQIPAVPIFTSWKSEVQAQADDLNAISFVVVRKEDEGTCTGKIIPVGVFLRPRTARETEDIRSSNYES